MLGSATVLSRLNSTTLFDSISIIVASGIIVHLLYKKYEIEPSRYLESCILLVATPGVASWTLLKHFPSFIKAYLIGFAVFYSALLSSVVMYRISPWHPLAKYPGPFLAKVSKFWIIGVVRTGKQHLIFKSLHDKYGPFVRTGPNEVSVADVDIIPNILGPDGMTRGPLWDGRRNPDHPPSLISTRSHAEHARMRKPWNRAFSMTSVKDYGPTIAARAGQLADELEKRSGAKGEQSVNLSKWMAFFAFDFMGDMAFGGGFELMGQGDTNRVWELLEKRIISIAWQHHLPWATRILLKLPFVTEPIVKFRNFSIQCAERRRSKGSIVKDLFYHLINEDEQETSLDEIVISGELAIIAGSDTTSTVLSGIFYHLLASPLVYQRLQKEIDATFPPGSDPFDATKLAEMRYLNAVINETLRIQPALPVSLQRAPEKGSGGKWIDNHFFPEGTAIIVSPYVLHHDSRYFSPDPEVFRPERWIEASTPDKNTILNQAAFIPFSYGPANCVGKPLAIAEIRAVVAVLLQRFDITFDHAYDPQEWFKDLEDLFVMKVGRLPVRLTPRK